MEKYKNESGLTLISLTITIIVLLVLVSISVGTSYNVANQAASNTKLADLNMVQQAILERYIQYKKTNDEGVLVGEKIMPSNIDELQNLIDEIKVKSGKEITIQNDYSDIDSSVELNPTEYYYKLDSNYLKTLGLQKTNDTYIVNYETGEVINMTYKVTELKDPLYISK